LQTTPSRFGSWALQAVRGLLTAYAQVFFSRDLPAGLLFLAATFVVPARGLAGLAGWAMAVAWARLLGRPASHFAEGFYGFNGLLVGMALGQYFRLDLRMLGLLAASTLLVVLIAASLRQLFERYLGLPVLSLSLMLAAWTALLAARRLDLAAPPAPTFSFEWGAGVLPPLVETFLRSLGAVFFLPKVAAGLLVLAGLLWFSRWAAILAVVGYAAGALATISWGGAPSLLASEFHGFNFLLTAIAVGGIWILLEPGSILLAAIGGAAAAVVTAAFCAFLDPLGLPVLAMPFVVTTQLLLYVSFLRARPVPWRPVRGELESPEAALSRAFARERRFPDPSLPVVFLPVLGRWRVTQGPDGPTTHQGPWSQAWDFEVADEEGRTFRNEGRDPADHFAFGLPAVAPGPGRVVRVVDGLPDNAIGEIDTKNNWGNLVILWHSADVYSALCHLQKGSIAVAEGAQVSAGQVVGRVGNSGRSPVPHLHFQLQSGAEAGAPTRRCEFIHYLSGPADRAEYVTHGAPATGESVAALDVEDLVRNAAGLPPGRVWDWTVREAGRERRESWRSEVDALGQRRLLDAAGGAELPFFVDGHYTAMLDYRGSPRRLLALFYLGLSRLPFVKDERVTWTDRPAAAALVPAPVRVLHEFFLPLFEILSVRTKSRLELAQGRVRVVTELSLESGLFRLRGLPERVEVDLAPGAGPVAIRAFRGGTLALEAEAGDGAAR
jgi:urea transporter/murein DD-endopeptidase MepM/ murein hydrolase activator NlpD